MLLNHTSTEEKRMHKNSMEQKTKRKLIQSMETHNSIEIVQFIMNERHNM